MAQSWTIFARFVSWKRKWRATCPLYETLTRDPKKHFVFDDPLLSRSTSFQQWYVSARSLITKLTSIYPTCGAVIIGLLTALSLLHITTLPLLDDASREICIFILPSTVTGFLSTVIHFCSRIIVPYCFRVPEQCNCICTRESVDFTEIFSYGWKTFFKDVYGKEWW